MAKASPQKMNLRQPFAPVIVRQVPAGTLRRPRTPRTAAAPVDNSPRFTQHGDGTLTLAQYQREQRAFWAAQR